MAFDGGKGAQIVDERFGKAPLFISHDAEGRMITRSLDEMGKTTGPAPTTVGSGTSRPSEGSRPVLRPKSLPGQEGQPGLSSYGRAGLWLAIVAVAAILTYVVILFARRNRDRGESSKSK